MLLFTAVRLRMLKEMMEEAVASVPVKPDRILMVVP